MSSMETPRYCLLPDTAGEQFCIHALAKSVMLTMHGQHLLKGEGRNIYLLAPTQLVDFMRAGSKKRTCNDKAPEHVLLLMSPYGEPDEHCC